MERAEEVRRRIREVKEKVQSYAQKALRNPNQILILGATKSVPPGLMEIGREEGIKVFGENTVQEASYKIPLVKGDITWHMIGHLQRNKVKKALRLFSMIETVDRISLVREIEKRAVEPVPCLIEVNTSGEPSKFGVHPEDVPALVEEVLSHGKVDLKGLMTLGPYPPEERKSRKAFSLLRELRDTIERRFSLSLPVLSMGMTEDYHWAILEGATEVRIGRGLFGERPLDTE